MKAKESITHITKGTYAFACGRFFFNGHPISSWTKVRQAWDEGGYSWSDSAMQEMATRLKARDYSADRVSGVNHRN